MSTVLGNRVLLSRRDLDMKQGDLARHIGVSRAYISKIETGIADNITVEVLVRLAESLGVSVTYLLGQTDMPAGTNDDGAPIEVNPSRLVFEVRDAELRSAVIELMDMVREMTPPQRRTFIDMTQKLKRLMDGEYETSPIIIE